MPGEGDYGFFGRKGSQEMRNYDVMSGVHALTDLLGPEEFQKMRRATQRIGIRAGSAISRMKQLGMQRAQGTSGVGHEAIAARSLRRRYDQVLRKVQAVAENKERMLKFEEAKQTLGAMGKQTSTMAGYSMRSASQNFALAKNRAELDTARYMSNKRTFFKGIGAMANLGMAASYGGGGGEAGNILGSEARKGQANLGVPSPKTFMSSNPFGVQMPGTPGLNWQLPGAEPQAMFGEYLDWGE